MENETQRLARQLTDDRKNPDLLVFEKTWGHRMLAGVSVAMLIAAFVFAVYCGWRLIELANTLGSQSMSVTFGFVLYTTGFILGVLLVPPAILGIHVAKHPKLAVAAIVAAVFALLLLAGFVAYALTLPNVQAFSVLLYACVGAILPILYLLAAIKIKRS